MTHISTGCDKSGCELSAGPLVSARWTISALQHRQYRSVDFMNTPTVPLRTTASRRRDSTIKRTGIVCIVWDLVELVWWFGWRRLLSEGAQESALSSQCFDTVGWTTGRASIRPVKTCCAVIPDDSNLEQLRKEWRLYKNWVRQTERIPACCLSWYGMAGVTCSISYS